MLRTFPNFLWPRQKVWPQQALVRMVMAQKSQIACSLVISLIWGLNLHVQGGLLLSATLTRGSG